MKSLATARLNLVHDWLTGMRGGEKCLEVLCRHFPTAPLYTLLHAKGQLSPTIERMSIRTSFLQRLPGITRHYRYALPLMPFAARWPLAPCDLVVSFSHAVAKAAVPPPGVPHVCHCFTPMRYAWHMREAYFGGRFGSLKGLAVEKLMSALRWWDQRTSSRVTHFIANSRTVQERIRQSYGRGSVVIYSPVDTDFYALDLQTKREDYFLVLSAFAPYKRVDLAIEACNRLKQRLVIIGSGQDAARLKALAGPTVQFLGWQSNEAIRTHLQKCRALLFPGEEDFGIVPVEANACGAPAIVFGRGGATETIVPWGQEKPTGIWFLEQTAEAIVGAIELLNREKDNFDPTVARARALLFDQRIFEKQLLAYLEAVLNGLPPT